jgi:hypothetical protein
MGLSSISAAMNGAAGESPIIADEMDAACAVSVIMGIRF